MNSIEIWLGIITALASGTAGLLIFAINRTAKLENRLTTLEKESEVSEKSDNAIDKCLCDIESELKGHNTDIIRLQSNYESFGKYIQQAFEPLKSIPKIEQSIAVILSETKGLEALFRKVSSHEERIKSLEITKGKI